VKNVIREDDMAIYVDRMMHAPILDVSLYEEAEADEAALRQAMGLVALSSLAAGVGSIGWVIDQWRRPVRQCLFAEHRQSGLMADLSLDCSPLIRIIRYYMISLIKYIIQPM
jgi:hypothetical protein